MHLNATSTDGAEASFHAVDIVVVVVYFAFVIGVGIFAMCKANRGTVNGYFLAGRSMLWFTVGSSLFVSNIGTEHFIGLAGSGAAGGISVGAWEFNAVLLLQLLVWIFVPVYLSSGVYTLPEYLSKRFGGSRLRIYFSAISILLAVFIKCSVNLYTGGLFIQQSLKWDLYLCIILLILITAVLTVTGGLTAVMYTDTLQATLMVAGGMTLMGISFYEVGGFTELYKQYPAAETIHTVPNTTCHQVSKDSFRMLRDIDDDYMPWLGFLLGQTPGSIWYWCADQTIVQRALAAKSISHAKAAGLMAGFIKILPLFMMVFPGMIARVKFPDEVGCVVPEICYAVCQSEAGCSSIAYPKLVLTYMPIGVKGLMMAVIIAALMSDLDSIFNSASTIFTMDIWKHFRPRSKIRELMIVGRVFVILMTIAAVAWVPVIKETQGGEVFIYIQELVNYFAPPFAMIYLLAMLVPRVNEKGTFWGLMVAFVIGVIRLILSFVFSPPAHCGIPDTRPSIIKDFHYMYFALFLFGLTGIVTVAVSLCTEKPDPKLLVRTTFWTRHDPIDDEDEEENNTEKDGVVRTSASVNEAFDDKDAIEENNQTEHQMTYSKAEGSVVVHEKENKAEEVEVKEGFCTKQRLLDVVCGVKSIDQDDEADVELQKHLREVASLKQDPRAKLALRIGVVFILLIGAGLYVFWSIWSDQYAHELCGDNLELCRPKREML